MRTLYQLRYMGRGALPTSRQVETWGRRWIRSGKAPRGISIHLMEWSQGVLKNPVSARERLKRSEHIFFGCPGVVKQYAKPNLTLCDYDVPKPPNLDWFCHVSRLISVKILWVRYDRTKRGWHVVMEWERNFKPIELVALQAILGSDPQREAFNLARVFSGKASETNRWNLLFERKL